MRKNQAHSDGKGRPSVNDGEIVSLGRHEFHCSVCAHSRRQEIEQEWISWGNTSRIARKYRVSRDSIYRHALALDLFSKRQRNIRKALERIIEQAENRRFSAA